MIYILCFACLFSALGILYLKYRVIFTGERCHAKIVDIADEYCGYSIKGVRVKKHAYVVKIKNKCYHTAHGCLFTALGKTKIGKEIIVYKNSKYGNEVFKLTDFRIEILALMLFLFSVIFLIIK